MKLLFAGTPETAATVLRGLFDSGHEIVAALTREDAPVGRKKVITPSPVAQAALELGIMTIKANRITEAVLEEISDAKAEFGVVVAYGVLLKREALEILPSGWFNLHYSLLPRYRGAAPVQRAIQNGDLETGITVFKLDEGMDTGAVLAELPVQIQPEETAGELLTRLNQLGISLLNQELPKLYNDSFVLTTQSGEVSLASKPTREDAKISFTNKAETIVNQVRAFNPEPVAWCLYKGEPFRILRARVFKGPNDGAIGSYSLVNGKVVVKCSDFGIELIEVQPSSKKVMSAIDWYRGAESQGSFE